MVFNALIVSSIRLDLPNVQPEVGASTFNFTPTPETKIFISRKSMADANKAVVDESTVFNEMDFTSQIRQVRTRVTMPGTYSSARCFTAWTDNNLCRPYTIFTLADKYTSFPLPAYVLASKILSDVLDCMQRNKGILRKETIAASATIDSTDVSNLT